MSHPHFNIDDINCQKPFNDIIQNTCNKIILYWYIGGVQPGAGAALWFILLKCRAQIFLKSSQKRIPEHRPDGRHSYLYFTVQHKIENTFQVVIKV